MTTTTSDRYTYMVSDYTATGEGRTVSLMIMAQRWNESDSPANAYRAFEAAFGDWWAKGLEILSRDEFFDRYSYLVPDVVRRMSNDQIDSEMLPGNLSWQCQFHFNFS